MLTRLNEYKEKIIVLKQIQSNKAKFYKKVNTIQNFLTVFVSAFLTFIGFSGIDKIKGYILMLFKIDIEIEYVELLFNLLVFILFFIGIFHLVFQFGEKQKNSENAITLLSNLANEIDNLLIEKNIFLNEELLKSLSEKYEIIVQTIPANSDKEYIKAKKNVKDKEKIRKTYALQNLLLFDEKKQEKYILHLIEQNKIIQDILLILSEQEEELYIGGGIIRNLVWDNLHGYSVPTEIDDVDIIYYNKDNVTKQYDKKIETELKKQIPNLNWSVKNQARMHICNNDSQYSSLEDALSKWPETVSAILVRKDSNGMYKIIAPYKYDDLFRLIVVPTPHFKNKIEKYRERINKKQWNEKWKKLKIFDMDEPNS